MSVALTKPAPKKSTVPAVRHRKRGNWGVPKTGGRVVRYCVQGATGNIIASDFTPSKLNELLRAGLPIQELHDLQACLDLPLEKLFPMLGISKATLHRRKAGGRLGPVESERVVRFAKLMGKAVEVMESDEQARQWLTAPQFGLGGAVPLEYAETEVGAREVEDLLGRIEHGIYS